MFEVSPDITLRLQTLHDTFAASLPARFATIDQLWATIKQQNLKNTDEAEEELRRAVHTLAGSAGTFGQKELGVAARNLEQLLNKLLNDNAITTATIIDIIENELSILKKSVLHQ